MRITIKRIELTIYSTTVELSDEEAARLLASPRKNTARLAALCPAKDANRMDAEDAEYEVEEEDEAA